MQSSASGFWHCHTLTTHYSFHLIFSYCLHPTTLCTFISFCPPGPCSTFSHNFEMTLEFFITCHLMCWVSGGGATKSSCLYHGCPTKPILRRWDDKVYQSINNLSATCAAYCTTCKNMILLPHINISHLMED